MASVLRRLGSSCVRAPRVAASGWRTPAASWLQPTAAYKTFALGSSQFPWLRAHRTAFVDKTGAIADLLSSKQGMRDQPCVFFARPRKFGKSLTLSVAAEMLAAGELPQGVKPWKSFERVDIDASFGGLDVHTRLLNRDASLGGLLQRAHFVIDINLGGVLTGTELRGRIFGRLASIAGSAFGDALEADVRQASTPDEALEVLLVAVPRGVPVAVLVDEYDAAIIRDVTKGSWAAANAGIEALHSLLMATKALGTGARIERCIVTGVARFAHASLFSGANNFADLTSSPLLSRVLGFSKDEICASFPEELERLASHLRVSVDGAVAQLEHWYNGYCFDGETSCFNPFPVLQALDAGTITTREMEAASGTNWLGLSPIVVLQRLAEDLQQPSNLKSSTASVDIANLEAQKVAVVPLLLQTGLLTVLPGRVQECRPPNEYARQSLERMLATAMDANTAKLPQFTAALQLRDRAAFTDLLRLVIADLPLKTLPHNESAYHSALYCSLRWSAPLGVNIRLEDATRSGASDITIEFAGAKEVDTVWIVELGIDTPVDTKLAQAQRYAEHLDEKTNVLCCAMSVEHPVSASVTARQPKGTQSTAGAISVKWSQRTRAGPPSDWVLLP